MSIFETPGHRELLAAHRASDRRARANPDADYEVMITPAGYEVREIARPKRAQPEAALQRAVAQLLDAILPSDATWFAIPNGGKRPKAEAAIMRSQGVKAGLPDLMILWQGRVHFIELKAPRGHLSPAQRLMIAQLRDAGAPTAIMRSVEGVLAAIEGWGIPTRLTKGAAALEGATAPDAPAKRLSHNPASGNDDGLPAT